MLGQYLLNVKPLFVAYSPRPDEVMIVRYVQPLTDEQRELLEKTMQEDTAFRRIFPPPPSDNVLISGGLVRFLEPLCTHVISYDYLVFYFMSDIIKPCILRSFPIALRRQRSCCASRFATVTRSANAPWPTCPIGSPRAWRPCVGLSGANSIISPVGTRSVVRSLVSSMR